MSLVTFSLFFKTFKFLRTPHNSLAKQTHSNFMTFRNVVFEMENFNKYFIIFKESDRQGHDCLFV